MKLHLHNGPFDAQSLDVSDSEHRITHIVFFHDGPVPILYECDEELEEDQQPGVTPIRDRFLFYNPDRNAVMELLEAESL
jgi:hypothetical protein